MDSVNTNAAVYNEYIAPTMINSYIILSNNSPTEADLYGNVNWPTNGVGVSSSLIAVKSMITGLPSSGHYISQIIDTKQDTPNYTDMSWNEVVPSGSSLTMKIRSGNSRDLSDAPAWSNVTAMASSGSINPGNKRYFQLCADFSSRSYTYYNIPFYESKVADYSPLLKDVTVKWDGIERYVDIGGTFTKGPDHGIFKVLVDGKDIKTGVIVNLEIFETARGLAGENKKVTSFLSSEVTPRNTGL